MWSIHLHAVKLYELEPVKNKNSPDFNGYTFEKNINKLKLLSPYIFIATD